MILFGMDARGGKEADKVLLRMAAGKFQDLIGLLTTTYS